MQSTYPLSAIGGAGSRRAACWAVGSELTQKKMVPLVIQSEESRKHIVSFITQVMRTKYLDGRKEQQQRGGPARKSPLRPVFSVASRGAADWIPVPEGRACSIPFGTVHRSASPELVVGRVGPGERIMRQNEVAQVMTIY